MMLAAVPPVVHSVTRAYKSVPTGPRVKNGR